MVKYLLQICNKTGKRVKMTRTELDGQELKNQFFSFSKILSLTIEAVVFVL